MIFLLSNWKSILASVASLALAWMLHTISVNIIENGHREEMSQQKVALENQCSAEKALTQEVSNDYQKKLSSLNTRYNALAGVQPSRCVTVAASNASCGYNATSSAGELSGKNVGVTSDALFELARDAEQVRLQLLGCQSFLLKLTSSSSSSF